MTTRTIAEEATAHAGVTRQRVLSLVDRLHKEGRITFDMYSAAVILRDLIMAAAPPTVGVSSYDGAGRGDAPHGKADRLGRRLTGYEVDYEGRVHWVGGRKSLSGERKLEDALFAAVGLYTDAGERNVNIKEAHILIRACVDTEDMPTLAAITRELSNLYPANAKGANAFALGHITVWLSRLSRHLRMVK